jgi:ribosomal protein S18 acetylase RimI-like enzyme
MRIEDAVPQDARAIAEIGVLTWRYAYKHILPAEYLASLSVDAREAGIRASLEQRRFDVLVARDPHSQDVIGFVAFGPSRDADPPPGDGEIYAIYVAPPAWSTGAGRQLCVAALERLRARGFRSASLWVFVENARALRFYRAMGFAVEPGSEKQFRLDGMDADVRELRCSIALAPA